MTRSRKAVAQYNKQYYKIHRLELLEYSKKYNRENYQKKKIKVFKMISKNNIKCISCNLKDVRVLQINHKNGDGHIEMNGLNYYSFFNSIINGKRTVSDLDLRCANCNILYEFECGRRGFGVSWKGLAAFATIRRHKTIQKLGGECVDCHIKDMRLLQINH
ncbi:MAG: hypothetical protein AABY22_28030, partial [Nanoarchaeota archaeon]